MESQPRYKIRKVNHAWYLFEQGKPIARCSEFDLEMFEWVAKKYPETMKLFADIELHRFNPIAPGYPEGKSIYVSQEDSAVRTATSLESWTRVTPEGSTPLSSAHITSN